MMRIPFGMALFLGAFLLFWVQPLSSKMLLPFLGGGSGVWLTCMLFFQTLLLAGYFYAHVLSRFRHQLLLHAVVLILPAAILPILDPGEMTWNPSAPVTSALCYLLVSIGLPFLILSSTAPLLQKWFARVTQQDPYHLYALSNLGSLGALISFPFLLEPQVTLKTQSTAWSLFYALFAVLVVGCGIIARGRPLEIRERTARIPVSRKLYWILLSFIPSSLLLGVTNHMTTDLAAVPLLWILPLFLYLLSFVITFSGRWRGQNAMVRIQPLLAIPLVIWMASNAQATALAWIPYAIHLLAFFVIALVFHGQLSISRPEKSDLTEFYLWLSVGGWTGGVFNVLIAPLLFNRVIEYPLVFALACFCLPTAARRRFSGADLLFPIFIALVFVGSDSLLTKYGPVINLAGAERTFIVFGIPALLCLTALRRPVRFGLAITALLVAGISQSDITKDVVHRERTFYGVYRIEQYHSQAGLNYHLLVHGSTIHGMQCMDPRIDTEPLAYYHAYGAVGHIFSTLSARDTTSPIAAVGLGTGAVASYVQPGRKITFFEIDPAVDRIARNPAFFTYLEKSPGRVSVVLGDARLSLEKDSERYGLLILDAFSSDAIPVHLLTKEAMSTYLAHMNTTGMIAFHISNRHLDLTPVISRLARNAGLHCYLNEEHQPGPGEGHYASKWMVAARDTESLTPIIYDPRWSQVEEERDGSLWTDDFSNILETFRWR